MKILHEFFMAYTLPFNKVESLQKQSMQGQPAGKVSHDDDD
jgi:hypothetical protein